MNPVPQFPHLPLESCLEHQVSWIQKIKGSSLGARSPLLQGTARSSSPQAFNISMYSHGCTCWNSFTIIGCLFFFPRLKKWTLPIERARSLALLKSPALRICRMNELVAPEAAWVHGMQPTGQCRPNAGSAQSQNTGHPSARCTLHRNKHAAQNKPQNACDAPARCQVHSRCLTSVSCEMSHASHPSPYGALLLVPRPTPWLRSKRSGGIIIALATHAQKAVCVLVQRNTASGYQQ